jgi:hypothetical protein
MTPGTQTAHDPTKLARAGAQMNGWRSQTDSMKTYAASINVSANDWGAVGAGFASDYSALHSHVVEHLGLIEKWLGSAEKAMKASAENYARANQGIIDAINALGKDVGGSKTTAGGDASYLSVGDPLQAAEGSAVPLSNAISGVNDAMAGDFGNLAGDIGNLAANSYQLWIDPLNALISAGLGFLESFIVPLQRIIAWVTGNPTEIGKRKSDWATVRTQLTAMAKEMNQSLSSDLATWEGEASAAAKKRIGDFLDGVHLTIMEIGHIEAVLDLSAALMTVALDVVNGILGNLVEWLIITWVAAMAGAAETCGATIPAAEGISEAEAAEATAKGTETVSRVGRIFEKLRALLRKILGSLRGIATKNFRNLTASTEHQGAIKTRVLEGLEKNSRDVDNHEKLNPFGGLGPTYVGASASALGGLGQSVQDAGGDPFDNPSSDEIDHLLNPDS